MAYARRRYPTRRGKFTAYGEASIPGFGHAGFNYDSSQKRLQRGRNYFAPTSGVATSMKTASQPIMTASKRGGAVTITQREILTTVQGGGGEPSNPFSLTVYDVNPGLSTICSWGSELAKAFQEYKMSFRLVYTSSCPSATAGQIIIAFDHNVGNPTLPTDKQQLSNFSNCVSSQVWAPMTTGRVHSGKKFYIRDGPVPEGQSIQLYDFTKILVGLADQDQSDPIVFGTLYIEYTLDLYLPRLQFNDESIIFSQLAQADWDKTAAEIQALDYQTPVAALFSVAGTTGGDETVVKKTVPYVQGGLEAQCILDVTGNCTLILPQAGYYTVTFGNLSTQTTATGGAPYMSWPDISGFDFGYACQGWSVVNPDNLEGAPGTLHNYGGSLPDDVVYSEQQFLVYVSEPGTMAQNDYYTLGGGWLSCPINVFYTGGAAVLTTTRCYNSFISVAPISPGAISFFNPSFYLPPIPSAGPMTGRKHMQSRHVQKYESRINRRSDKPEKKAVSVPFVEVTPPESKDQPKGWFS